MLRPALACLPRLAALFGRLVLAACGLPGTPPAARGWRPVSPAGVAPARCRIDRRAWAEIRARYRLTHRRVPA